MLKKIRFKNYKAFKTWQTIDLRNKFTVLVGPNSAGKSSIIKLLGLLKQSIGNNSNHPLLNIRGPIFDLVDFESISYRKELKDLEIELISQCLYPIKDKSLAKIINVNNKFSLALSNKIGANKIKQNLMTTKLDTWTRRELKDAINHNVKVKEQSVTVNEEELLTPHLDYCQNVAFKEINSKLSDIFNNQLGKPGFYKNKEDLDQYIKHEINRKINVKIEKNGLIPGKISFGIAQSEEPSIKQIPYSKAFCDLYPGQLYKEKRSGKGCSFSVVEIGKCIKFPFEFFTNQHYDKLAFYAADDPPLFTIENQKIIKQNENLDDYLCAINDHYNSISEFVKNKKNIDYVSMQVHSYLNIALNEIHKILFVGKNRDIHWETFLNNNMELISVNMSGLFEGMDFSPSIRPNPEKFQSKKDLLDIFSITPDTNFTRWNKALNDMGFNYEVFIEVVSRPHDLYAIKFKDTASKVESYLDEVGYGFSQFLPYLGKKFSIQPKLHLMEQPELHLHPDAQARLPKVLFNSYDKRAGQIMDPSEYIDGDYSYLNNESIIYRMPPIGGDSYPESDDNSYLIETHSEHILRGIQIQVAKGKIHHSCVAVYYVGKHKNGNSYVEEMKLDKKGKFTNKFPKGFFDTGFKQAMELMKAR